ncbi:ATP-dependent protease ClpP protease subunit [Kaistia hirudinis]|uniref:ATP-dependent protease ClpP protease subunit n=1 Tax=Kaistia hirudinis TaxID=1293440 RepID=A0A840AM12_9HYPH|nr:ATP-dependent Clp protease proteolytic subunit [Kaistia hirudinis]MBB3930067.1 ATP-dependent protease ClpP protease subunit [Kaistia hirudinis]
MRPQDVVTIGNPRSVKRQNRRTSFAESALPHAPRARRTAALRLLAEAKRASGGQGPRTATIRINGVLDEALRRRVERALAAGVGADELRIDINSPGGDAYVGLVLYRLVREHPAARKVATVNARCCSAAMLPLLAADERRALPNAELLLHQAEAVRDGASRQRWTTVPLARAARDCNAIDATTVAILVDRTGLTEREAFAELAHERPLPIIKALSAGILTEVIGVAGGAAPAALASVRAMTNAAAAAGRPIAFGLPRYYLRALAAGGPEEREGG